MALNVKATEDRIALNAKATEDRIIEAFKLAMNNK